MVVVDHIYEFTNGMTLPYVAHSNCDRWMFAFAKSDAVSYGHVNDVYFSTDTST